MTARPPGRPGIAGVLDQALAQVAARAPGERALVDQNTEVLRTRLARAGIPVTPGTVAAFAAGVAELASRAERASGVRGAAASLLHAAAQLAAPAACPACVAALDHALTDAGPPTSPGEPTGPRGGGAR